MVSPLLIYSPIRSTFLLFTTHIYILPSFSTYLFSEYPPVFSGNGVKTREGQVTEIHFLPLVDLGRYLK